MLLLQWRLHLSWAGCLGSSSCPAALVPLTAPPRPSRPRPPSRRRASNWREVVQSGGVPGIEQLPLAADVSPLSELLNLAWAEHEICSDPTAAFLDWVEGGFRGED